jgi:hypothetical protein
MPSAWWYHTDEKIFENAKERYAERLKNKFEHLRKTECPLIGKPCIGCDCTSYVEPVHPIKSFVYKDQWVFERWIANVFNKPYPEPYTYDYEFMRCRKNVFK